MIQRYQSFGRIFLPGTFQRIRLPSEVFAQGSGNCIETTLIGRSDFSTAMQKCAQEFQDALPHIQAGDADYGWVNVADARAAGIKPLPWH